MIISSEGVEAVVAEAVVVEAASASEASRASRVGRLPYLGGQFSLMLLHDVILPL
jgi:hypothetical protein